jgi:hypothetical protein
MSEQNLKPHRAHHVLFLGLLGLGFCFIFGIFAWIMANNDLREMAVDRMNNEGKGQTQYGRMCARIGIFIHVPVLTFYLLYRLLTGDPLF